LVSDAWHLQSETKALYYQHAQANRTRKLRCRKEAAWCSVFLPVLFRENLEFFSQLPFLGLSLIHFLSFQS